MSSSSSFVPERFPKSFDDVLCLFKCRIWLSETVSSEIQWHFTQLKRRAFPLRFFVCSFCIILLWVGSNRLSQFIVYIFSVFRFILFLSSIIADCAFHYISPFRAHMRRTFVLLRKTEEIKTLNSFYPQFRAARYIERNFGFYFIHMHVKLRAYGSLDGYDYSTNISCSAAMPRASALYLRTIKTKKVNRYRNNSEWRLANFCYMWANEVFDIAACRPFCTSSQEMPRWRNES